MKSAFGPWATAIGYGPRLSTFWKQRMTMLPFLGTVNRPVTTGNKTLLAIVLLFLVAQPLVLLEPMAAGDDAAAVKPGRIVFLANARLATVSPDAKEFSWLRSKPLDWFSGVGPLRLSPDGKRVAYWTYRYSESGPAEPTAIVPDRISICALDGAGEELEVGAGHCCWSPDGSKLAVSSVWFRDKDEKAKHWLVDVQTKEKTELKLPNGHMLMNWSADGDSFLTVIHRPGPERIQVFKKDGSVVRTVCDQKAIGPDQRLGLAAFHPMVGVCSLWSTKGQQHRDFGNTPSFTPWMWTGASSSRLHLKSTPIRSTSSPFVGLRTGSGSPTFGRRIATPQPGAFRKEIGNGSRS